jgi:hypothetical protein
MIDQLTLRRSAIAYLYRENPSLSRDEHLKFYDSVTGAGVDVLDLSIQGPELVLSRKPAPGAGALEIRVGSFGGPQLRLLVQELPADRRPTDLVWETADLVWDSFRPIWGGKLGEPNLTEVTLDLTAPAPKGDSRSFLAESVARIDPSALHHLGRPFEGFGLRFMSGPSFTIGSDPQPALPASDVNLRIETLLRDPSQVFFQLTIKWPALNVPVDHLPAELREQVQGPVVQANIKAQKPSHYLKLGYDFVVKNVAASLKHAAD